MIGSSSSSAAISGGRYPSGNAGPSPASTRTRRSPDRTRNPPTVLSINPPDRNMPCCCCQRNDPSPGKGLVDCRRPMMWPSRIGRISISPILISTSWRRWSRHTKRGPPDCPSAGAGRPGNVGRARAVERAGAVSEEGGRECGSSASDVRRLRVRRRVRTIRWHRWSSVSDRPRFHEPGWVPVTVRAASLNMHDIWTLRGVGIAPEHFPMILGCDGAGILEDGTEVVIHSIVNAPDWRGDDTLDPQRTLLTEIYQGTFADVVMVPEGNAVAKPPSLSAVHAAVMGTAWLTAYRMLFVKSGLRPGQRMLVQGASGGVSTALIQLGRAAGMTVWVTGTTEEKRALAVRLGAHEVFEPGAPSSLSGRRRLRDRG